MIKKFVFGPCLFAIICGLSLRLASMEEARELYPCKILPVTIHADFYPHLLACLKKNKSVKDAFCGDFPLSKKACTVHIVTKDMIHPDANMDRFHRVITQENLGKNAQRKLKNIIAAYKELSFLCARREVELTSAGEIRLWNGSRLMNRFSNVDLMVANLCAIAKLKYLEWGSTYVC